MIQITKASGEIVPFDPAKLRRSLKRVGTDDNLVNQIVDEVTNKLSPGMSTHAIYQIAFRLLRNKSRTLAAKYHLKRAIMHLGLSGYPFEKYFAELLRHQHFQAQNNQIIQGYCIDHEVDVVAMKDNRNIYVECKYHHRQGLKCDVTIALYIKARFLDIQKGYKEHSNKNLEGWLVTNTRFTSDALKYGRCAELHLVAWDYPEKDNLKEMVELSGLYPITCITNLTKAEIAQLIGKNIILCKSIHENPKILDQLRIPMPRRHSVLQQCEKLCMLIS